MHEQIDRCDDLFLGAEMMIRPMRPNLRVTPLRLLVGASAQRSSVSAAPAGRHRRTPCPSSFIAGDSTAANYSSNGVGNSDKNQQGWAAVLQPFFSDRKLRVVNAARGGRSSRTFITEGHWDKMLAEVRAGDFVIIQFGHNDAGALNQEPPGSTRRLRARGTIPGIGNESEEIDNVITGKHETVTRSAGTCGR